MEYFVNIAGPAALSL